ncbi:hypothetical protein K501DRAFT_36477 [Backusella circina FSU 941]|nr:hypothetical protein K501DRAFT_36477 [Backusella circina FSU 941]
MSFQLSSSEKTSSLLSNVLSLYMSDTNSIHKNLTFILDILLNHRLLHAKEDNITEELSAVYKKWTVRLNALLQSKTLAARWSGITLVRVTCEQSPSLLIANAKTWTAQLLGFLAKAEPVVIHQETIKTLCYLFTYTSDKPELQREIANPNLQRYNQLLLSLGRNQPLLPDVLDALTANIKSFPSTARHIADQTLQLCLSCLDGTRDIEKDTITKSNTCLIALYSIKAGNNSDQWKECVLRLISSIHQCLNRLFDTVDEEYQQSELPQPYPFSAVSVDYIQAFPILLSRIQLLQNCISHFLTTPTSIVVNVPVVHLVDLMCRIYSVFEGSLMRDYKEKNEFFTLMMCLPALHLSTSKMFSSLLYCSGQEMMRYSKLFSRILVRLLGEHKHKRTLKIAVYQLISLCLGNCGYSFGEIIAKPLIQSILGDLDMVEHKISAPVPSSNTQKSHKKRKTEVTNSDLLTSRLLSAAAADVQIASLQALASLLETYGFAMENGQRSSVDGKILSRLIQVIQPYDLAKEDIGLIKYELYNCLIVSVMHPIETQASILPHALRLFGAGVNEQSNNLQSICKKGLSVCDLITHSRLPPVQRVAPKTAPVVAVTVQEEEEAEEEYVMEVTENKQETFVTKPIPQQSSTPLKNNIAAATKPNGASLPITEKITTPTPQKVVETPPPVVEIEPVLLEPTSAEPIVLDSPVEKSAIIVLDEEKNEEENEFVVEPESASSGNATTTTVTTTTTIIEDNLIEDEDMEMPLIDMAGPDSDDDE